MGEGWGRGGGRSRGGAPAWSQLSSNNKSESGQLLCSQSHHHRSGTCRVSKVPEPPHNRALRHFPFYLGAHKVYSGAVFCFFFYFWRKKGNLKSTSTLLYTWQVVHIHAPLLPPLPRSRHGRSIVQVICMIMPVQKKITRAEARALLLDINKQTLCDTSRPTVMLFDCTDKTAPPRYSNMPVCVKRCSAAQRPRPKVVY